MGGKGDAFTSDFEISEATTSLVLRSEPIYAGRSQHDGGKNRAVRVYRSVQSTNVLVGE